MTFLTRLFLPRWKRLADEADRLLADATVHASWDDHGQAAARYVSAALTYEAAAECAPVEYRPTLINWTSQCAYRAACECDAFGHAFKPERPRKTLLELLTSPTQNQPKERV